jgi:hypothetical protein
MITEKQINEALGEAYKKAGVNAYFGNGFQAGVKFAQEQIKNLAIPVAIPSVLDLDLKQIRKDKGLTLSEVEKITGISTSYLSQIETGKIKSPGYNTVKDIYELYSNFNVCVYCKNEHKSAGSDYCGECIDRGNYIKQNFTL